MDAVIVSYPKSGRTWLQALIGQALASSGGLAEGIVSDLEEFSRQLSGIPCLRFVHAGSDRPRSYAAARTKRMLRWVSRRPVLLLVRDPRDVAVSYWLHRTRRLRETHELSAFLHDPEYGIDRVIEFLNFWDWNRDVPPKLSVFRYEDLRSDPAAGLREVLEFLGIHRVPRASILDAVARCSFEQMRAAAASGTFGERISPVDPLDPESAKVRRGKVGGFADYLDVADIRWATQRLRAQLVPVYSYPAGPHSIDQHSIRSNSPE